MTADPWLPIGMRVAGASTGRLLQSGDGWQIFADGRGAGRVLVAEQSLAANWIAKGLLAEESLGSTSVAGTEYRTLLCDASHRLSAVELCPSPQNLAEALSFASAIRRTRDVVPEGSLASGLFVEAVSAILPVPSDESVNDSVVLGRYLTGGVSIPIEEGRRLADILSWLSADKIAEVCEAAGVATAPPARLEDRVRNRKLGRFLLPGRPHLESFFREHVIDIVENAERYAALGVQFPGAVVLHGPPGSGKTFAVDRLVEYLGWPRFEISSGSVGSPFIHETGRKVSSVFTAARKEAPSVVVIDEMEAFLSERSSSDGSATHHVEEVAEFLRQIQDAGKHRVLVLAMTNRIDTIDNAIIRRGRFDHLIEVGMATDAEVEALLMDLLRAVPHDDDVDASSLARSLGGRPLADVAFVLREAARLTARDGGTRIGQAALTQAVASAKPREDSGATRPRIGFS
jgi:cell division protease FtsH